MRESQPHLGHSVQVVVGSPRVNYTSSRTILLEGSLGPVESFGSMTEKYFMSGIYLCPGALQRDSSVLSNAPSQRCCRLSILNTRRKNQLLDISALIDIQTCNIRRIRTLGSQMRWSCANASTRQRVISTDSWRHLVRLTTNIHTYLLLTT